MADQGFTLVGILPFGGAQWRKGCGEQDVDKSASLHGFALSEAVPLEDPLAQAFYAGAREEH